MVEMSALCLDEDEEEEELKSKETEYRDKLVMKLQKKADGDLHSQKSRIKKTRNEGGLIVNTPVPTRLMHFIYKQ